MISPKPGDVVRHKPSGETWTVAIADPSLDSLVACGWPCAIDKLSDCEIIEVATLEDSKALASQIAELGGSDLRASRVRSLYPELFDADPRGDR